MQFSTRHFVASTLGLCALLGIAISVSADSGSSSPTIPAAASDAAKSLIHLKHELHAILWQNGSQMPSGGASSSSPVYEISAKVNGRVSTGDQDTLLLQMSNASIDASIQQNAEANWLDSGARLRLLIRDNVDQTVSHATYTVVAAAPEAEVAALDTPAPTYSARQNVPSKLAIQMHYPQNFPAGHPICRLSDRCLAVYPYYRAAVWNNNRHLDESTVNKITTSILAYSDYYKIDPRLIMAMIIAESGFDPSLTSHTGAMGLGQLMPETAAGLGITNPYDPVQNVGAAVKILSDHVAQYGGSDKAGLVPMNTLLLTMAAYNAGGGAVRKFHGVPPFRETQEYVRRVSSLYSRMCAGDNR